jgi:hypothetical protein
MLTEDSTIAITDIYWVAYVTSHHVEILRTQTGRFSNQLQFIFDRVAAQPLVDAFNRGGSVNAQQYAASIRFIKRLIHGGR